MRATYDFTSETGIPASRILSRIKSALRLSKVNPDDFDFKTNGDSVSFSVDGGLPGRVTDTFDEKLSESGITWTEIFDRSATGSFRRSFASGRTARTYPGRSALGAKAKAETKWFRLGASITATEEEWEAVKEGGEREFVKLLRKNGFKLDGESYSYDEDDEVELELNVSADCKVV